MLAHTHSAFKPPALRSAPLEKGVLTASRLVSKPGLGAGGERRSWPLCRRLLPRAVVMLARRTIPF